MENEIKIIPTEVEHIRLLVENLRDDDRREAHNLGVTPFKGIWRSYRNSKVCNTCFIGNKILAICGINGSLLGFTGNPWVMTSKAVDEYPFVFAMLYRREVQKMLKEYRSLESYVDVSCAKSIQLMRILGFKEREIAPQGKNGALFMRLEMMGT